VADYSGEALVERFSPAGGMLSTMLTRQQACLWQPKAPKLFEKA